LYGRFANARMGYPLAQIAGDGLDKLRQRVVPVIKAAQRAGVPAAPAVCVVRAWARWLIGDPARAGSDQSAELLQRVLGAGGGDDTMRGLLELVGLPELEIE
jgi:fructuronate reductase